MFRASAQVLRVALLFWGTTIAASGTHIAHAQATSTLVLSVQPDASGCLTERALRERVGRWQIRGEIDSGLAARVDARAMPIALQLLRAERVVAQRSFDVLPERCTDRVAAVALVIVLALEHAGATRAPEAKGAASTTASERASDQAETTAKESSAAQAAANGETSDADAEQKKTVTEADADADTAKEAATPEPDAAADEQSDDADDEASVEAFEPSAGVGVLVGPLPAPVILGVADIAYRTERWRASVGGVLSSQASADLSVGTTRSSLLAARAAACLEAERGAFEGCAGILAGAVSAEGDGYFDEASVTLALVAPFVRLSARYPTRSWIAARMSIDGLVHLVRPELQVSGRGGASESGSIFGAAATLELVVSIR